MSENEKKTIARYSLKYLPKKGIVGIGSGSTVNTFLEELVNSDLNPVHLTFVPGSLQTLNKLISLGLNYKIAIPPEGLDIVFDGADYWTLKGDLIKGGGGALYREKMLFYNSKKIIVIAGKSKKIDGIGGPNIAIPIEVPFFGLYSLTAYLMHELNANPVLRIDARGNPFNTDNSNLILDTYFSGLIEDPMSFDMFLKKRPEVICTGIFSGFQNMVLISTDSDRQVIEYSFDNNAL